MMLNDNHDNGDTDTKLNDNHDNGDNDTNEIMRILVSLSHRFSI